MAKKLPSNSKRVKAAARAIEYRAAGKSWREIDDMVKQEHPDCAATAVLDAMYRLDHLEVEDWLPRFTVIPESVQRYQDAYLDWWDEVGRPYSDRFGSDGDAFRKKHGVRPRSPESRAWAVEWKKNRPFFVPPDPSMVKDYRDLP
jgi:hypothetical protein